MTNSFREMQVIYEGYRDNGLDLGTNTQYTPTTDLKNSYSGKGQMPTGVPGDAGSAYSFNQTRTSFEDEEGEGGVISRAVIANKISEMISRAEEGGNPQSMEPLFELLKFVYSSDKQVQ